VILDDEPSNFEIDRIDCAVLVTYRSDLESVDWEKLKATLSADDFDNGRSPEQLRASFANSYATCLAYAESSVVGTARVLSDGVSNAYLVDIWTLSAFRQQGVARTMIELLLEKLQGQHIYLFTEGSVDFYKKLGFVERPTGMEKVVGQWLVN
jgi:ribosomal protein S18 acetylase RimI-like enzyme